MLQGSAFRIGAEHHLFHADLRTWRKARGITQRKLAEMAGLGPQRVTALENFRAYPNAKERAALARVTGLAEDRLFPAWLKEWATGSKRVTTEHEVTELMLSETRFKALPAPVNVEDEAIDEVDQALLKTYLGEALATLKPRQREVIELRYGLDRGTPRTLKEVAAVTGGSIAYARCLEAQALHTLRVRAICRAKLSQFAWAPDPGRPRVVAAQPPPPPPEVVPKPRKQPMPFGTFRLVQFAPTPQPAVPAVFESRDGFGAWLAQQIGRRDLVGKLAAVVRAWPCCTQDSPIALEQHALAMHAVPCEGREAIAAAGAEFSRLQGQVP